MSKIAAFFDVDGTIFRDSLLIKHFKLLIKNDLLPMNAWTSNVKNSFEKWANRDGDYDTYLEDLVNNYTEGIKSIEINKINDIAIKVIDLYGDKLYRYTRERIKFHKEQGHLLVIISGSPKFLVEKMAKKLGFDMYFATEYFIKDNYFVDVKSPMWDSESKKKTVNLLVKDQDIDLSKSYAYGDTNGDYTMLSLVGNPFAINPAKKLITNIEKDEKLKQKIQYIIERKDVIYTLNSKNLSYIEEE